jgi:hypothetical protein
MSEVIMKNAADLLKVNVNDHTEKKNNLTYLSWAWAWAEVLKADHQATFKVEMFQESPLMPVGDTFMVWVTVTIFGKPVTCMLPVLDYRNKCIPAPTAFDVNTSIMRCLTKAIAMHGLGLYIYAGEDLPEADEPVTAKAPVESDRAAQKVKKTMPPIPPIPKEDKDKQYNTQPTEWDNSDDSRELFTYAMLEMVKQTNTSEGLDSLRENNTLQIKSLSSTHPEKFERIKAAFVQRRKEI